MTQAANLAALGTNVDTAGDVSLTTGVTGTLPATRLPAGSVLQVVSTNMSTQFSGSVRGTWTDITGLSASITPTSTSSKILVQLMIGTARTSDNGAIRLVRNSTAIAVGNANGTYPNNTLASIADLNAANANGTAVGMNWSDSPATTSAVTYKAQYYNQSAGSGNVYINEGENYTGNAQYRFFTVSNITLMEIAA